MVLEFHRGSWGKKSKKALGQGDEGKKVEKYCFHYFGWFLSQSPMVFLHTCASQYLLDFMRGHSVGLWDFSPCTILPTVPILRIVALCSPKTVSSVSSTQGNIPIKFLYSSLKAIEKHLIS